MVEFKIKVHHEQKLAYMPKWLTDNLGYDLRAIPDNLAVLMFPQDADPQDVVSSLDIIRAELLHSMSLKQKGAVNNESG
jgi:hypothetical protein